MATFDQLASRVTPQTRAFFDYLWEFYLKNQRWPSAHEVYRNYLEKPELSKLLGHASGALVLENEFNGQTGYELRTLGILCTTRGDEYRDWLHRLVGFLRDVFYLPEKKDSVSHTEVREALSLSESDVLMLGRIPQGFVGLHPYFTPDAPGWKIMVPAKELEDLPKHGPIEAAFVGMLNERAKQAWKVSVRERAMALAQREPVTILDDEESELVQSNPPRRFQVFVSSTFEDLKTERQHVIQALLESHCIPAGMELFPAASVAQWKLIQRVIAESDYYVVIVAGRYGSSPPRSMTSYTEREFDYAKKLKKPILGFYHADPGSIPRKFGDNRPDAAERLAKFVAKVKRLTCRSWQSPTELAGAVKSAIHDAIRDDPQPGWIRAPAVSWLR